MSGDRRLGAQSSAQWNARRVPSEKTKNPLECGIADGETRTRTGDTTIFSCAAVVSETRAFAGNYLASGQVYGVRVFPDFARVSPVLRQIARAVCLFAGGDRDPDRGRGGAAGRLPLALGHDVAVHSAITDRGHDHHQYRRKLSPRRETGDRLPLHRPLLATRPRVLGGATGVRLRCTASADSASAGNATGDNRPARRAPEPRMLARSAGTFASEARPRSLLVCVERDCGGVIVAFHGCRSAAGPIARQRTPGRRPRRARATQRGGARLRTELVVGRSPRALSRTGLSVDLGGGHSFRARHGVVSASGAAAPVRVSACRRVRSGGRVARPATRPR